LFSQAAYGHVIWVPAFAGMTVFSVAVKANAGLNARCQLRAELS
jgi:hypothetical protein